jgi:phosphomannomutase
VPELIESMGGKAVRTRVGHSFIKAQMRELNAIFGGEHSGHFYFRDNFYADSGLIALLVVLELVSKEGKPVSELIRVLDKRVRSGEVNSEVRDIPGRIQAVRERYADGTQDDLDGLTVQYDDWWFNLRPSNTEPLLRLNVEADTRELMEQKRDEVLAVIRQ